MQYYKKYISYLCLAVFVFVSYIIVVGQYYNFCRDVVPAGDPFTYTVGFYNLLDLSHKYYFGGIARAIYANWYWALNLFVAVFSPILIKQPFSIAIVNYIAYFIASASFFRLARSLNLSAAWSFVCALVLWIYPVNYGFDTYSSMPVLGLDSMFNAVLYIGIANLLVYMLHPESRKNAILAGIGVGFSVWGRGNSLPVVFMIAIFPSLVLFFHAIRNKQSVLWVNFVCYAILVLLFCLLFYGYMWGPISTYYTAHVHFVERHHWTLSSAIPYFKNIPGFFFLREANTFLIILICMICHIFMLFALWYCWRHVKLRLLVGTAVLVYFATFLVNVSLFTDPQMNIYNCLLIYRPMILAMTLAIIAVIAQYYLQSRRDIRMSVVVLISLLLLIFGYVVTRLQTPSHIKGTPSPFKIKLATQMLRKIAGDKGTLLVLWYGNYNPVIFSYYQLEANQQPIPTFYSKNYNYIWSQWDYSPANSKRIKLFLKNAFAHATIIILPSYARGYGWGPNRYRGPYAFYRHAKDMEKILNAPGAHKFVVRMVLQDRPSVPLLVLQRKSIARGQGVPLKLPYGPRVKPASLLYPSVPHF